MSLANGPAVGQTDRPVPDPSQYLPDRLHGTIGKCETPIRSLAWTEDGKWLLIGEEGVNDGSGQRQDDYYLLNLATMTVSTVVSTETAFWLPGRDQIVYLTPQDLALLPGGPRKRNVYSIRKRWYSEGCLGRSNWNRITWSLR